MVFQQLYTRRIYLCTIIQLGEIEGLASRNLDVIQDDSGAGLLAGTGFGS